MGYWSNNGYAKYDRSSSKKKTKSTPTQEDYEYEDEKPKSNYWANNGYNFYKKEKPKSTPATSFDRAESELAKKKAALKTYGIDDPTDPNRDDRNFVEKAFNTPKNTGFLGDIFDVLSRGQYTSANLAKNFARDIKENGASEILKRANPLYSLKKTFGEEGREAIKEGITGERKGSYDEVLDEAGMKKGLGRSALGFVGDVALDPTTYMSGGGTALAKVGGKVVSKVPGAVKAAKILRESKPVEVLGKAFVPNFREAGTAEDIWNGYVDLKRGYENTLKYSQNKAVEDAIDFGKPFTKKDRELISHALQDPVKLTNAPQHIKDAVAEAQTRFKKIWDEENTRGLIQEYKDKYLPGIYPEKSKGLEGIIKKDGIKATVGKHKKQKTFDTLQEAINAGYKPETDIAKLLGHRDVVSKRATTTQDFIDETLQRFGQKIKHTDIDKLDDTMGVYMPKGNLNIFPQDSIEHGLLKTIQASQPGALVQIPQDAIKQILSVSKNVPVYALPKQIATDLNNFKKAAMGEDVSKALKYLVDKPTNLWKLYATATNPGFHIRNAASNMFQTYLNDAKSLANPLNHAKSLAVLASDKPVLKEAAPLVDKLAKLTKTDKYIKANSIDIGGKTYSLAEAKELMKKEGILNQGWFDKEVGSMLEDKLKDGVKTRATTYLKQTPAKEMAKDAGKVAINTLAAPFNTNNILGRLGRYVGGGVEDQARIFNTIAELKKSGDLKQAKKVTDKYLFDYGDLTDFERNIMKRGVPFYTWLRKNLPLQAENLVEQPGKYAAIPKAINAVENQSEKPDEQYLPEYMENWVRTPFNQSGNPIYLNPNMPYGDLDKLNPSELSKTALSPINPLAKVPLELFMNKESFFDRKIEDYPGQTRKAPGYMGEGTPDFIKDLLGAKMKKNQYTGKDELQVPAKARYLMKQVPFIENISKSMDYEGDKKFNQLLSFIAGAKIAPYEIEKEKRNKTYSDVDKLREFFKLLEADGKLPDDWDKKIQKKKDTKKGW